MTREWKCIWPMPDVPATKNGHRGLTVHWTQISIQHFKHATPSYAVLSLSTLPYGIVLSKATSLPADLSLAFLWLHIGTLSYIPIIPGNRFIPRNLRSFIFVQSGSAAVRRDDVAKLRPKLCDRIREDTIDRVAIEVVATGLVIARRASRLRGNADILVAVTID